MADKILGKKLSQAEIDKYMKKQELIRKIVKTK
jgi:c-di-AMP phosphodiesterase-like protein